jgi:hypothetical protein
MINPIDCDGSIINTKSFFSIQCIAYFLRQEIAPMKNKAIDKIVRHLQSLADELTLTQASIDNLGGNSASAGILAASGNIFGGDLARMSMIYQEFQAELQQLQKQLQSYEKELKAEGKIP